MRSPGNGRLGAALSLLLAGAVILSSRPAAPQADPPELRARFVFAGGDAERRALADAVAEATADLGIIRRFLARSYFRWRLRIPEIVDVHSSRGLVSVQLDERELYVAPIDGQPVRHGTDAHPVMVTHRWVDGSLVQTLQAEEGTRRRVYRFTPSGLQVEVTLKSERLDGLLRYALTYRREAADLRSPGKDRAEGAKGERSPRPAGAL